MSFFEHASRVPMIVSAPGRFAPAGSSSPSLMDVLPTLVDLRRATPAASRADGRELIPISTATAGRT